MKVEEIRAPETVAKYENVKNVEVKKHEVERTSTETKEKVEIKNKNIEEAVEKINKQLEASNTKIKFKIHDSDYSLNDKVSIKIIDEESEKVIAEIPSEEAIELSERMHQIIGFLFDASK